MCDVETTGLRSTVLHGVSVGPSGRRVGLYQRDRAVEARRALAGGRVRPFRVVWSRLDKSRAVCKNLGPRRAHSLGPDLPFLVVGLVVA